MNEESFILTLNQRDLEDWVVAMTRIVTRYREELSGHRLTTDTMDAMAVNLNAALIENVLGRSTSSSPNNPIGYRWFNGEANSQ